MSNSIYRLLMRWTHRHLYPLLSPVINTCQFGGRRGVSTAHATQAFLNDLDMGPRGRPYTPLTCTTPLTVRQKS